MSIVDGKKVKLFSLSSNKKLAQEISEESGIPLSECEVTRFADGEIGVNITESVRGHHVFVIQPTSKPVNDHLMEILIFTDALKRASAASITIIMPYYGYSRQDRKAKSRQPITAKLVADLLQVSGVDRVICIDLHAAQIQGFFDIPIDNFPGMPLLASYFLKCNLPDVTIVSPDHGGVTRARSFAKFFNAPIAIIDKRRPEANKAEVMNIIGDVAGRTCIMVDDIIDTGGTLMAGAQALVDAGAKAVYAAATHPLFSNNAIQRLQESAIKKVVVTNTVVIEDLKKYDKITQLSIGQLLGRAVINIIDDEPISQIFERIYETHKEE
ncbi:ribose-phosphate diphosphokinase [Paracholeplasma manati]|jgi:ribose-phosphate pyrophosphokinase|uniref:Ribose-phosphate pyrophosphokinase n=1 Tax=Paracholeplasma manati TaxID=591373 RepID=A0ABT2Y409_9MOLU|nr:ribose-phosphate diphosphokinase [Paracholeplasma manati]MCV2231471.1 ribose-phosphate diphosphokinase [Paracholeplasma manati]MDG0889336.1 ribose-phosphate diphosphokinase [Paracholeplasma manati]MDX9807436.1 ribose-phosphate diphosphokinase [Acholeplasma sp.]